MGGFGSGKGFHPWKIKSERRLYVTELPYIDSHEVDHKWFDFDTPFAEEPCFGGWGRFKLKLHILPNGAEWFSFECCCCGRGARRLYFHDSKVGCRKCFNLAYPSENRDKTNRSIDMKWKIIERISTDINDMPNRPKGMHHKTFNRLRSRIVKYNLQSYMRFFNGAKSLFPDLFDD